MVRHLSSSYWVRLLLLTLLIGMIPVIALGSLSFLRAKQSVQEKVNDSNMQLLQQTQLNVEQVLQLFENLMTQYISTSTVHEALQTPFSPNNFVLLNELVGGLNKIQPYELGIKNVYVASLDNDWVLSNEGYSPLDTSPIRSVIYEYAKSESRSFWNAYVPGSGQEAEADSGGNQAQEAIPAGVHLVKKLPINRTLSTGLIMGEISAAKLEKLVYNEAEERETLILDSEFRPLTSAVGSVLKTTGEWRPAAEMIRGMPGAEKGHFIFKANRETISVNFTKSNYNGWYYLSFASLDDITRDSRSIGWYTLFISLGTFVLILLLAWIGSKRMYMPIRRVLSVAVDHGAAGDPPQHKDELQVIGESIHRLRTSQTLMKDQLRIHSKQLEVFFIRRLLQGEIRPKETKERLAQFGYEQGSAELASDMPETGAAASLFAVMTVQIDSLDYTRYQDRDVDLLMFAIGNITSELIPANRRFEPVVMVDNQVTICRSCEPDGHDFETELYHYAEDVQRSAEQILGLKVSVGISTPYPSIHDSHQAYKQSLDALNYRLRFGEQAILLYTSVSPESRSVAAYPDWLEKELIDSIKTGDKEKARGLLNEFAHKIIADYLSYEDLQMVLTRLLIDLLREGQEGGESTTEPLPVLGKPLLDHLQELKTAADIEQWFFAHVVEPMIDTLLHQWENRNKKISERLLEIIHNEYDTNLTVELCASRLNYHPNYVRTVFRKETGSSFSDYLSQYRLAMAKQWLVETDMKIGEIAEKLQYQNSQNFIRYFRKMENTTPGQYREKHRID
ncbi:HTH-type transcriptional regulator YesS [Paenibacillus konkukensis]|uniref:HTH-type transcriptional regulator YesS n=1 Tax=Paenibacillus konkukensis TaxID=2020716 RepID=A0ABY4RSL6_9BACL|nr:AraC family transcriptional regulator [Paenibacillus konkukensis]UQZ85566.1 HTH-type transcriptional regulator YesS [Paenibacillus konkukensis]